jgi:hypothetical protein
MQNFKADLPLYEINETWLVIFYEATNDVRALFICMVSHLIGEKYEFGDSDVYILNNGAQWADFCELSGLEGGQSFPFFYLKSYERISQCRLPS